MARSLLRAHTLHPNAPVLHLGFSRLSYVLTCCQNISRATLLYKVRSHKPCAPTACTLQYVFQVSPLAVFRLFSRYWLTIGQSGVLALLEDGLYISYCGHVLPTC